MHFVPCLTSIYHRWKAFDIHSKVAGACGEFITLNDKYGEKPLDPLGTSPVQLHLSLVFIELVLYNVVAVQNFEDKVPDILDKQYERHASAWKERRWKQVSLPHETQRGRQRGQVQGPTHRKGVHANRIRRLLRYYSLVAGLASFQTYLRPQHAKFGTSSPSISIASI